MLFVDRQFGRMYIYIYYFFLGGWHSLELVHPFLHDSTMANVQPVACWWNAAPPWDFGTQGGGPTWMSRSFLIKRKQKQRRKVPDGTFWSVGWDKAVRPRALSGR